MKRVLKLSIFLLTIVLLVCGCTKKNHIKEITLDEFKKKIENKESFAII